MSDRRGTTATEHEEQSENEQKVQDGGNESGNEDGVTTQASPPNLPASPEGHQVTEVETIPLITVEDGQFIVIRMPIFLCFVAPVMAILIGMVITFIVMIALGPTPDMARQMAVAQEEFGQDPVDVFRGYDVNQDNHLSLLEYSELFPHIKDMKALAEKVRLAETYPEYTPSEGEEVLIIHANFSRLHLKPVLTLNDLLSFDLADLGGKLMQLYMRTVRFYFMPLITGQKTLYGLDTWTEPNRKHEVFGVSEFKSLLPEDMDELEVGLAYPVLQYSGPAVKDGHDYNPHLKDNSRKYVPTVPQDDKEKLMFRLLAMMHPRPFLNMRFHPRGTMACVQAFNEKYVHIVFRMHAEFQLSEAPANPFWFSPAQFVGDLVISRDGSHVHYFHMHVPNERKLNVDMEWLLEAVEGYDQMEVDIGYLPLMEWTMGADSHLPLADQSIRPDLSFSQAPSNMVWSEEVPREEVLRQIEVEFFEFKKVSYHNLTHAVHLSKKQNKPLHAIFLWGALDDQSC